MKTPPAVRRTVLPGGVRVLTEAMPGLRSATVGAWVGVGSRDEADHQQGATHFLEHLLFKGTARRSALEIASAFDRVGGEANAATAKEYTCYYARVLDDDLPMAVDVIADMVTSAKLDPGDVDNERGVILEELAMNDDDPADVVHERFSELVLGPTPLGRPIGGTPATISGVSRDDVWAHYRQHYRPEGLVLSAAGGVDHDRFCDLAAEALREAGWDGDGDPLPGRAQPGRVIAPSGSGKGTILTVNRPTEQAHVVLGGMAPVVTDRRRFVLAVLNAALGGGMSSRLFQEIREKRGLAYSVYSFTNGYSDSGVFGMYAGCTPDRVGQVVELLDQQARLLAGDLLDDEELDRAIGQLCGGMVLGMEDTGSRMSRLGKAELVYGEFIDLDEALALVRAVTAEQVRDLAAELYAHPRSLCVVGPFEDDPVTTVG